MLGTRYNTTTSGKIIRIWVNRYLGTTAKLGRERSLSKYEQWVCVIYLGFLDTWVCLAPNGGKILVQLLPLFTWIFILVSAVP